MKTEIHMLTCPKHGEVPCPVCVGELHGKSGGESAAKGMTVKQRKARASNAAKARWKQKKPR